MTDRTGSGKARQPTRLVCSLLVVLWIETLEVHGEKNTPQYTVNYVPRYLSGYRAQGSTQLGLEGNY